LGIEAEGISPSKILDDVEGEDFDPEHPRKTYGSVLEMRQPVRGLSLATGPSRFGQAAGRVQPIAAVANRPRADRDEAERALRSALSTLQRMSGAA